MHGRTYAFPEEGRRKEAVGFGGKFVEALFDGNPSGGGASSAGLGGDELEAL